MRLIVPKSRYSILIDNLMYRTEMKADIQVIHPTPLPEMYFLTKGEAEDIIGNLDIRDHINEFKRSNFPFVKGDFLKSTEDNQYYLRDINTTDLTDPLLVVNNKGLVIKNEKVIKGTDWVAFDFAFISKTSLPKTVEGLGIENAIRLDKDFTSKVDIMDMDVSNFSPNSSTTPNKIEKVYTDNSEYRVGDTILTSMGDKLDKSLFKRLNGQSISIEENPELFELFKYDFSLIVDKSSGLGGYVLARSSLDTSVLKETKFTEVSFPLLDNLVGAVCVRFDKYIYFIGGSQGIKGAITGDIIRATPTADGNLTDIKVVGSLPIKVKYASQIIYQGGILIIGGSQAPNGGNPNLDLLLIRFNDNFIVKEVIKLNHQLPYGTNMPVCFTSKNRLHIEGGFTNPSANDSSIIYKYISMDMEIVDGDLLNIQSPPIVRPIINTFLKPQFSGLMNELGAGSNSNWMNYSNGKLQMGTNIILNDGFKDFTPVHGSRKISEILPEGLNLKINTTRFSINCHGNELAIPLNKGALSYEFYTTDTNKFYLNNTFNGNGDRYRTREEVTLVNGTVIQPRNYFNVIQTNGFIYLIGGMIGNEDSPDYGLNVTKTLRLPTNKLNPNYTTSSNTEILNSSEGMFDLPSIDPILLNGDLYEYYIKVR